MKNCEAKLYTCKGSICLKPDHSLEVEGFVTDETDEAGGRWKQLVFQDKPYLPPTRRESLGWSIDL